ncbi:ABC transporter substrate-binding protein [Clostridioides difficile]
MRKRKLLSLVMAVTLTVTCFVGCGKKEDESVGIDTPKLDGMDKTPITLTFFNCDLNEDWDFSDDVAKKITELTGVTLEITHPVAGDTQAIPLMIASGEYPDLIYAKGDTGKLIDAGAIIKLDDMIEEKGENLKALYGDQLDRLRASKDDPSIYTVGTYGVSAEVYEPGGTLQVQHDVLKNAGYPEIKTIYDYEELIKKYIEENPTTEDGQERIGLSLMASDWRWLITTGNVASAALGIPDDGQFKVDDETGETTYKFTLPEIKEYFQWLNHMNDIGLLDPESFTQKEDTYKAKISSGRVVGLSDAAWDYQDAEKTLLSEGKAGLTYARLPVTISEEYKDQSLKNYGFGGGWGIAISESCKNKDRAFEFLDWMASDEAQVLLNWGIEGEHYTVEDGKRVVKPEVQEQKNTDPDFGKKTGIGAYVYPFPQRGIGAIDSTGNSYTTTTIDNVIANYNDAQKETLAGYGVDNFTEMFPSSEELGISKHGQVWQYTIPSDSDISIIQQKCDDYIQQAVTQAILGKPENFDKAWDEIQSTLENYGVNTLNEEMTNLTKERLELWN